MSQVENARKDLGKLKKKELVEQSLVTSVALGILGAQVAAMALDDPCGPDATDEERAAERAWLDERSAALANEALQVAQSIVRAG